MLRHAAVLGRTHAGHTHRNFTCRDLVKIARSRPRSNERFLTLAERMISALDLARVCVPRNVWGQDTDTNRDKNNQTLAKHNESKHNS